MKKIIFGMAAAAAVSAFAQIESANVVGYNTGSTGADNNFITIPFTDVGYNTTDIQAIKLSDGGAESIGWGTETFDIWEGVPVLSSDAGFMYFDPGLDPAGEAEDYYWGDESNAPATFSIAAGQGVVVNCAGGLTITIDAPYAL